ncbi:MAG TPA: hypothetical protein DCK97_05030, partial [Tistrella mobilis]|nr:hypothetical protein [Tistrella mobilis]
AGQCPPAGECDLPGGGTVGRRHPGCGAFPPGPAGGLSCQRLRRYRAARRLRRRPAGLCRARWSATAGADAGRARLSAGGGPDGACAHAGYSDAGHSDVWYSDAGRAPDAGRGGRRTAGPDDAAGLRPGAHAGADAASPPGPATGHRPA